ncbi:pyrimidine utilization transport protein G, partial [Paraburkholderia sp. SIMBA_050]
LNLAPIAVRGVGASNFGSWMALVTGLCGCAVAVFARGMLQRLLVLVGLLMASVIYARVTNGLGVGQPIDFSIVANAAWFG